MPYSIEQLKEAGLYKEAPVLVGGEIRPGKILLEDLPDILLLKLKTVGGGRHSDPSREDSSVITHLLRCGLNPSDTYSTFCHSARGKDALVRRRSYFDDYLQRTIRAALSFLGKRISDYDIRPPTISPDSPGSINVNFSKDRSYKIEDGINVAQASRIETEKTRWLWPGYIPEGKITILAGDPGMGKSTIALDLVSRISCGKALPSGGRTINGTCLIASAEDAPEDTIVPRLIVAEANMERVGIIREVKIEDQLCYLSLPRDLIRLRKLIVSRGARILVIDPLNAFLERGTDTYKDQDIRSVLAPVENMAEETGVAVLIVAHLTKKEDSSILYRVGGSIGFIGAARSVLAVGQTAKPNIRVLYSLKSNLAKAPPALSYETYQATRQRKSEKQWMGEARITSSGIKWLGVTDYDPSKKSVVNSDKAEVEAEDFLRQALVDSEVLVNDIYTEARRAGISRGQLNRVKTELGLKVKKDRSGNWTWAMP